MIQANIKNKNTTKQPDNDIKQGIKGQRHAQDHSASIGVVGIGSKPAEIKKQEQWAKAIEKNRTEQENNRILLGVLNNPSNFRHIKG